MLEFENHYLRDIITPIKPEILKKLLDEAGYCKEKTDYLYQGFLKGFSLRCLGITQIH